MNHKVNSVAQLHTDAMALYQNVVAGGADTSAATIIQNLASGIEILKGCWKGKDAGVQIQNVVEVHNAMVKVRNTLEMLCSEATKIASRYRDIQNSNGAGMETLTVLSPSSMGFKEDYTDVSDTISINDEANNGKQKIDNANNNIEGFITDVKKYYGLIMDNWTAGTGRDQAKSAFEEFISKSNQYKETLATVSTSITTAIANYRG